jgi:uncharacterized membrane protein
MNKNKTLIIILAISLFWTISIFVAPLTISTNTINDLDGYANQVDYGEQWDKLPPYQRAIYYFGDFNCHQKSNRSFSLNGNQLPVDARLTSIFSFINIGIFITLFIKPSESVRDSVFNIFPRRIRGFIDKYLNRTLFVFIFFIICLLPVVFDGFYQLLTSYESTNLIRVLTGISTGWILGLLIGVTAISLNEFKKNLRNSRDLK